MRLEYWRALLSMPLYSSVFRCLRILNDSTGRFLDARRRRRGAVGFFSSSYEHQSPDLLFYFQSPSSLRTSTICAMWYALWSASSKASLRIVWPSPQGIFAKRFVFGLATRSSMTLWSARKRWTLLVQAAALGGAAAFGQYPSGHFGDTCLALRLNSRMSHCARRRCSRSIHGECRKLAGFFPRRDGARSLIASLNLAWAPPPEMR